MKRLLPLIILALLAPSAAEAQRGDRGERGGGREARAERRAEQGLPRAQQSGRREMGPRAEQRFDRQQDRRGEPGGDRGGDRRDVRRVDPRFDRSRDVAYRPRAKPGKPPPPGQAKRFERRPGGDSGMRRGPSRRGSYSRGHVLPPEFRRARMEDYARHRLRRPPPGYSYYVRGQNAYLVSDRSGMIFEVVPIGG